MVRHTLQVAPHSPSCFASTPVALSIQPHLKPGPSSFENEQLEIVYPASSPSMPCSLPISWSKVTSLGSNFLSGVRAEVSPSLPRKSYTSSLMTSISHFLAISTTLRRVSKSQLSPVGFEYVGTQYITNL